MANDGKPAIAVPRIIASMAFSYVTLIFMLLVSGIVTAGMAVALMAFSLLRPPRMNDGKAVWLLRRLSPGDLGLGFEEVSYTVQGRDGAPLKIAGWWIPCPSGGGDGRCVLLLHGYADAKVGAIAWAPLWQALGFNVLAIDLRATGRAAADTPPADLTSATMWRRCSINSVRRGHNRHGRWCCLG